MDQERPETPRPEERRTGGQWQQEWFSTPGDLDDFIFYDAPGKWEDEAACRI